MPVHDWTRVPPAIFHDFHHGWVSALSRALNRGLLPADFYALKARPASGVEPDVIAWRGSGDAEPGSEEKDDRALDSTDDLLKGHSGQRSEAEIYAAKANVINVLHVRDPRTVAVVLLVSPGNKITQQSRNFFVQDSVEAIQAGIHLLIVDLFPHQVHRLIWADLARGASALPADKPLTLASYVGDPSPQAFIDLIAVGESLPDMPLFLERGSYITVPLEATYQAAWEDVPAYWRGVLESGDPAC